MTLSNSLKIVLASSAGAIIVCSTVLFPLIKDLNKSLFSSSETHTPVDNEQNKTVQVISKDPHASIRIESTAPSIQENPSLNKQSVTSTNDPFLNTSDTLKSSLLIEDIPHYKRN